MEGRSVAKVGLLVLVAVTLAVIGLYYLSHQQLNSYLVRVHFKDTKGLLPQSQVRLKGVSIGEVKDVKLEEENGTLMPTVYMEIDKRYRIPSNYRFLIVSGLLITNPSVEVRPPANIQEADAAPIPQNGSAVLEGAPSASALEGIDPQLGQTVSNINASLPKLVARFDEASTKINKLLDQTNKLVVNSNDAIVAGKGIIADPRLKNNLLETTENFRLLSEDTRKTATDLSSSLKEVVGSSKGKFDKLSDQGLTLITKLGNTIDDANNVVKKLTEQVSDPRLQSSLQETVELARSTLSSVRQITSDLHQLTGDPALQSNLKESAANLRLTTERSADALEKLDNILGKVSGAANKARASKLPTTQLLVNAGESVDPARFRLDADARILLGRRDLLDVGLFDLGEDTRLNLQGGRYLTDRLLARYGLYGSKLGVGLEYGRIPGTELRADLYDANHARLDVRGLIRVNKNASIWAGANGFFRGDPVPTIGVQLNN